MKNINMLWIFGGLAVAYYFYSKTGMTQLPPSQGLPYGGYSYNGVVYAYDENGNTRVLG